MSKKRLTIGIIAILLGVGMIILSLVPLYAGEVTDVNRWNRLSSTAATETVGTTVGIVLIIVGALCLVLARKRVPEHTAKRHEKIKQAYAELERIQSDHSKKDTPEK